MDEAGTTAGCLSKVVAEVPQHKAKLSAVCRQTSDPGADRPTRCFKYKASFSFENHSRNLLRWELAFPSLGPQPGP